MKQRAIAAVETDATTLTILQGKIEDFFPSYKCVGIIPSGSETGAITQSCITQLEEVALTFEVVLILMDIVILEHQQTPRDTSGLAIAKRVKESLPTIPVVAFTNYYKEHHLLSECSLCPYLDGVLPKDYVLSDEFSKRDFTDTIHKAGLKARLVQSQHRIVYLPSTSAEGPFSFQTDSRLLGQVQMITPETLSNMLALMFPRCTGTVTFLRPGFSGSFLFKVTVRCEAHDGASDGIWVLKIGRDEAKLKGELENTIIVGERLAKSCYAEPFSSEVFVYGGWSAIGFSLKQDVITLAQAFLEGPALGKAVATVESVLAVLQLLYGEGKERRAFLWKSYYAFDERAKAGALSLVDDAQPTLLRRGILEKSQIERVRTFIDTDARSEAEVIRVEALVSLRLIHGDLNTGNALIGLGSGEAVLIDFAKTGTDDVVKDLAKLEADVLFAVFQSREYKHCDWDRLDEWYELCALWHSDWPKLSAASDAAPDSVEYVRGFILALRNAYKGMLGSLEWASLRIALLSQVTRVLGYPDVPIQKKALGVRCLSELLDNSR